jgi:hypothetical protein
VNLATQGLAESAQDTLTGIGPDAALDEIAKASAEGQPSDSSANAKEPISPEESSPEPIAAGTEAAAPTAEAPKVPGKVAENPDFKERWGELYAKAKQEGGEIDVAKIDQQALDKYYDSFATVQMEKGLPDEIGNDPLFQKELGKATMNTLKRGEVLDQDKLTKEALAKYQREKDLQEEQGVVEKSQLTSEQQRIQQLETEITQLNTSLGEMKAYLGELTKYLADREQDPERKKSLLALLMKIAAVVLVGAGIDEAGKIIPQAPRG